MPRTVNGQRRLRLRRGDWSERDMGVPSSASRANRSPCRSALHSWCRRFMIRESHRAHSVQHRMPPSRCGPAVGIHRPLRSVKTVARAGKQWAPCLDRSRQLSRHATMRAMEFQLTGPLEVMGSDGPSRAIGR